MTENPAMSSKSSLLSSGSEQARRLQRARRTVLAGDLPEPGIVRPVILESWQRSREAGVDPDWGSRPLRSEAVGPLAPTGDDCILVEHAAPIFDLLREALSDHPYLMMLTGLRCRPLSFAGRGISVREGEDINAAAGGLWREDRVGTDAVALSHAIGEPVQVHWTEHYATIAEPWTGNSFPLRNSAAETVVGTLNLYAYGCIAHPRAFELVCRAGKAIEREIKFAEERSRFKALLRYAEHLARHPDDAALCLDRHGQMIAASGRAATAIGLPSTRAAADRPRRVPGLDLGLESASIPAEGRTVQWEFQGRSLRAEIAPVCTRDESEPAGYLVRLERDTRTDVRSRNILSAVSPNGWHSRWRLNDLVGDSRPMRSAVDHARTVASRDGSVLLVGESGTGKEIFAHGIHAASRRSPGPFVSLNCGGLSAELLSAELFGYEDGAFTGASRGGRPGKLELANGGTLFLDEVEAMPTAMQMHLLRFLEDRAIVRVGGQRPLSLDVRIIAASNVPLRELIERGSFRSDLYYRLCVWPIDIPPLRDRPDDIGPIALHLLQREELELRLSADAEALLRGYSWPGNVRELRNVLLQASLAARDNVIETEDLSLPRTTGAPSARSECDALADAELQVLLRALQKHGGRINATARALGIHRATLYRKLRRHNAAAEAEVRGVRGHPRDPARRTPTHDPGGSGMSGLGTPTEQG
ncbi:MAG TPA: sigma 54-interacting transcriptional regulator [Gammaproteobacteria bacterium]|nr:sigma 54-interacting transcriptional regulator [Gammaproteobacteria bacterium]